MVNDNEKIVVLFQGTCRFCNWSKDFVLRQSVPGKFEFVAIESDAGIKIIEERQLMITVEHPNSIVVLNPGFGPKYKWQACLEIARNSSTALRILRLVLLVIPNRLGNWIYDWVGRHRGLMCKLVRCRPSGHFSS